jgi:hypothetical protein
MKHLVPIRHRLLVSTWTFVLGAMAATSIVAQEAKSSVLPFHREAINRYSLDHLPRSLSLRQGADVWFGYDLERAKLYKLWQSPANGSGLEKKDFVVRSVGEAWYEDKSDALWQLQRHDHFVPVRVRYQGCSHHQEHFELRWELTCDGETCLLFERIPSAVDATSARAVRELRVEGLKPGAALVPPLSKQNIWKLTKIDGTASPSLVGTQWYRMTLP